MFASNFISCTGLFIPFGRGIGTTPAKTPEISASSISEKRFAITEVKASLIARATGVANLIHDSIVPSTQFPRERISGLPGAGLKLVVISSHKFALLIDLLSPSATSALTELLSPVACCKASDCASLALIGPF